ncbi:hypothetical protein P3U44_07030 [Mammaliicoccus sciuri]|uniref:hypothetical protein n=1 Tax=Mammaliicoccus sciuri TaxID=1296 RepID=UPI002B25B8A4|nr:hypothetical protein [Mammaliicoccus sciuri]WQJ75267.1 hypothetical protein P3U44_07030 [Mammaliicoccus sciuri]
MPTIKTKKEMNLPELIEWGFKQKELPPLFYGDKEGSLVQFTPGGWVNITAIEPTDTFTVEVEEEITEDTKLFLISRCIGEFGNVSYLCDITTINSRLKNLPKDCKITHFYIENEENELQLIWTKEKGLVE